jgi:hypothetical protein
VRDGPHLRYPFPMPAISFKAPIETIGTHHLVRFPKAASSKLPSRGIALVEGTVNDSSFMIPLEPDGKGSHWFEIDASMAKKLKAKPGDDVSLALDPSDEWPEPVIPSDMMSALKADAKARATWDATTPIARWDWIRWIRSTNSAETRAKRVNVACSKLRSGMKRACCFNRSMCTDPEVSKGGVLLDV